MEASYHILESNIEIIIKQLLDVTLYLHNIT